MPRSSGETSMQAQRAAVDRSLQTVVTDMPVAQAMRAASAPGDMFSNGTYINPSESGSAGGGDGTGDPNDFVWVTYMVAGDVCGVKPCGP